MVDVEDGVAVDVEDGVAVDVACVVAVVAVAVALPPTMICTDACAISFPLRSLATNVIVYGPLPFHVHPLKSMFAIFTCWPLAVCPSAMELSWLVSTCQYI